MLAPHGLAQRLQDLRLAVDAGAGELGEDLQAGGRDSLSTSPPFAGSETIAIVSSITSLPALPGSASRARARIGVVLGAVAQHGGQGLDVRLRRHPAELLAGGDAVGARALAVEEGPQGGLLFLSGGLDLGLDGGPAGGSPLLGRGGGRLSSTRSGTVSRSAWLGLRI